LKFVQKEFSAILEEKKSKFISYLVPYNDFSKTMQRLKEEHPKAVHHVYAYRYLNEFEQIVENSSDDGEPKGTSGKPCLAVLAGAEIINTAVIVVRYFGGIKLGTGGLVKTYSNSVNEVIKIAEFFTYKKLNSYYLECEYNSLSQLEYLLKEQKIEVSSKDFGVNVKIEIKTPTKEFEELKTLLSRDIKIL
jgi:uncharacterized YigZ family protein